MLTAEASRMACTGQASAVVRVMAHVVVLPHGHGAVPVAPAAVSALLAQATACTGGRLHFALVALEQIRASAGEAVDPHALEAWGQARRQAGVLTVLLAPPRGPAVGSWARTEYNSYNPGLVLHGGAGHLLHALGHQALLRHTPQPALGLPWTTEDWHTRADGLAYLHAWAVRLHSKVAEDAHPSHDYP